MKRKAATGRRCYVCAPIAVDTSAIRAALHRVGSEIVDEKTTPPPGESPVGNILDMLRSVDFVCGVITAQPQTANVLFELGLAVGMQRSVLLVVDKSASIPVALESFPYVQVPLNDVRALGAKCLAPIIPRARNLETLHKH